MKQQQRDINFEDDSEKKSESKDGIWTHDPPWSSRMLSPLELLETLWWARANLWVSTGTASRGYTAK